MCDKASESVPDAQHPNSVFADVCKYRSTFRLLVSDDGRRRGDGVGLDITVLAHCPEVLTNVVQPRNGVAHDLDGVGDCRSW